jgi:hypothetical protein
VLGTAESLSAPRCLASGALYAELGLDAIVIGSPAVWDRQRKVASTASVHTAGNRLIYNYLCLVSFSLRGSRKLSRSAANAPGV